MDTERLTEICRRFESREVPAKMIRRWLEWRSEINFECISGREKLKERLIKELTYAYDPAWQNWDVMLKLSPVRKQIFYGPPGMGKTMLMRAAANLLRETYGFQVLALPAEDVYSSYVGVAEKVIATAFAVARELAPCVLLLDDLEELCCKRSSDKPFYKKRQTVAFLEAFGQFQNEEKPLVLLGATAYPMEVDEALMDKCALIRVPLPDREDRQAYFAQMLRSANGDIFRQFGLEQMAAATDQYSYGELFRLCETLRRQLRLQALTQYGAEAAAAEALQEGKLRLTEELFRQAQAESPRSDMSLYMEKLREYEQYRAY